MMRRTLLTVLVLSLVAFLGIPVVNATKITRLRLERAPTADGTYEHVPAETVPVAEGDFEDSFDSDSAFYRMRVDIVDDTRPPASLSLGQVPARSREIAQQHLDENRDIGGDNGWEDAELGPVAFPMYNPAVQGFAYIEFKVVRKPELPTSGTLGAQLPAQHPLLEDRGFILVSVTRNDFPILSYATEGPTRTEMLRDMAESTGVRIFRYDSVFMVAENAQGEMVAHLGSEPVKYPDTICDYMGQEWEHIVDEQGVQEPTGTPDLTGEAFGSYAAFKQAYLETEYLKRARQLRREEATLKWDLYDGVPTENFFDVFLAVETTVLQEKTIERFIVGDPSLATIKVLAQGLLITGNKVGGTVLHLFFVGGGEAAYGLNVKQEGMLSPEKPSGWGSYTTYYAGTWSDQRKYEQRFLSSEGCYTGCGGVAWAMLYGWFDYKGMADLIAPSGTGNATDYLNGYAALCVYTTRGYINSYCVGKSCATNPWDMPDGYKWASIDRGVHYSIPTTYSIPCFPWKGCRNQAIQSIRYGGKPAIIGLWCTSAHYCVAYGYRYRYYTLAGVIVDTDHDFKCNLGWGGSPSWETGSVWYGNNPHFW